MTNNKIKLTNNYFQNILMYASIALKSKDIELRNSLMINVLASAEEYLKHEI